ncbi:MAG: hypothetical protein VYD19_07150 [Myxococcota bacterium]|nr:hypothetical protein [Myxococcota bacterium]
MRLKRFSIGDLPAAESRGWLRFDDEALSACASGMIEAVNQLSCEGVDLTASPQEPLVEVCDQVIQPLQDEGDPCGEGEGISATNYDFVCAQGLFCDDQVCAKQRGEGAACTSYDSCLEGLFCNESGVCSQLVSEGSACESNFACVEDTYCRQNDSERFVCSAPMADGSVCESREECESGHCEFENEDMTEGVCAALDNLHVLCGVD